MRVRPMLHTDIPAGMRLVEEVGWNQTEADWLRFLDGNSAGCCVAEVGGQVCGTVTSIVYEHSLAWIGMMLVASAYRGRGIGRRLLEAALESLTATSVPTVKLDATPQGQPLYAKLGFVPEYEIERWVLEVPEVSGRKSTGEPNWPNGEADLEEIVEHDREIFGADRERLLRSLDRDAPSFSGAVRRGGELKGYIFGRRGLRADHLGPWVAYNEESADQLLNRFLSRSTQGKIIVDVPQSNLSARALVKSHSFRVSRPFTRMLRGAGDSGGAPQHLCAILGPEFG